MQSIKEHNLKANHNSVAGTKITRISVCNLSKNTIWKQITTIDIGYFQKCVCMQSIKEHNLKANHNNLGCLESLSRSVCNLSKNTIWKQITTPRLSKRIRVCLYAIYQRTQSESKSQLLTTWRFLPVSVCNLSKNTIWKQITTFIRNK